MNLPSESATRPTDARERNIGSIVLESALEAAWRVFILIIFGDLAVSLVGGIFQDMTPSALPGFGGAEAPAHASWHWSSQWLHRSAFYPIFVLMFAGTLWVRLRPVRARAEESDISRRSRRRLRRIQRVLRDEWFGLLVWNVFGAMVAAMVAMWVQRFSWVQFLADQIFGLIGAAIHQVIQNVFGQRVTWTVDAWLLWYHQNQLKLTFWLFYFAAICDDLGIPNVKTLGRWFWKRIKDRMAGRGPQSGTIPAS